MDTLVTYMNKTVLCKNRITSIPMHALVNKNWTQN